MKTAGVPQTGSRQEAKGKDIQVDLVEQTRLTLETPQRVKFRLNNLTKNYMRLQLSVNQESQQLSDIVICGCYPQIPGKLEGNARIEFELELFPVKCGVGGIQGLRIRDTISGKQYELDYHFAKFTVDFEEEGSTEAATQLIY